LVGTRSPPRALFNGARGPGRAAVASGGLHRPASPEATKKALRILNSRPIEPKGRPSPLMGALLALVLERPGYGYELAQRLNQRLGPVWRLDPKSVYGLLDRLDDDGLVRREVRERSGDSRRQRRERVIYYASDGAQEWVRSWLARPVRRESTRSELLAKMAVARPGDEPLILAALDEYERDILRLLEEYGREERIQAPGFSGLMFASVDDDVCTLLRADREWAIRTRRRITEYINDQER
jgi:DNA-binding PadR family transcriptional regulator